MHYPIRAVVGEIMVRQYATVRESNEMHGRQKTTGDEQRLIFLCCVLDYHDVCLVVSRPVDVKYRCFRKKLPSHPQPGCICSAQMESRS